jgi:predicted branched-subunit amino acid permease
MSPFQAITMSIVVLAGAAQLAAIDLIGRDALMVVTIGTALVINARFVMYSSSLAPIFRALPGPRKLVVAYLMTDQAYAFSINRFRDNDWQLNERYAYYAGTGLTLWGGWQVSTAAGALLGTAVPESWSLDFAVPLVFLALLAPAIRDRADAAAAVAAVVVAVAGTSLPYNSGLLIAAITGIGVGVLFERGRGS